MKIVREKPCQRRHHRLTAPLFVSIDSCEPLLAENWSLGGLCISGFDSRIINLDTQFPLTLEIPFQGYNISFNVQANVIRIEESSQSIYLEFFELSERSIDLMNHFAEDLIRGKMATIDDMICRIDVPVTPISTEPTPNPAGDIPIRRLPIKTIVMSSLYISLGVFVFGYLAVIAYSSFFKMEISSSVLSSKIQTIIMPVEGIIKPINYQLGSIVNEGEEIFSIESSELIRKINSRKSRVQAAENKLTEAKEIYRIEQERMKLYQLVNTTDAKILKAQLAGKKEELASADQNYIRLERLSNLSSISTKQLDDAKQLQNKVFYQLNEIEAKYIQATAMEAVSDRRHYNHKEFGTDLDLSAIKLQSLYSALLLEKQQLDDLVQQKSLQVVRAPYKGRITDLFQTAYSTIAKNEPILILEQNDFITINAYLNQDEILHIGLNDKAIVYIPALNLELNAMVSHIDRSSAYRDKKSSNYSWHDNKAKTALVKLELLDFDFNTSRLSAGLPAVVIFNRRSSNYIFSKFLPADSSIKSPSPHSPLKDKKEIPLGGRYEST
ncbi:MAG: hypothetical protein MJK12_13415 [Colwellia sp.]|nr:hypothetical protein [Colwellia sp.]